MDSPIETANPGADAAPLSTAGELPLNRNAPTVFWVDMNASFARAEQQARKLLRGKPVGVAAYTTPNGCVVSPSVEAKALGVKTAVRVADAKMLAPGIVILPPDPHLYREVHRRFCKVYREVAPGVTPKSIDEATFDVAGTPALRAMTVEEIGRYVKRRVREEAGCWMSCNVGVSTNRFLAKLAAGLHKPDGLDVIDHTNVRDVYSKLSLTDLPGINVRYEARLNAAGIFTPLQFLDADRDTLVKRVFQSVNGHYWYLRLRGWEIDAVDFARKSVGHSYALREQTADPAELGRLLTKLCEKTGARMRRAGFQAKGVHVSFVYADGTHWHQGRRGDTALYASKGILLRATVLMNRQPRWVTVRTMAVSVFDLEPAERDQLRLFDDEEARSRRVSDAMDAINERWGDFVITPATMLGMEGTILDRISFGGIRDIQDVYASDGGLATAGDDWGA
jgi:DNA polymerase-4